MSFGIHFSIFIFSLFIKLGSATEELQFGNVTLKHKKFAKLAEKCAEEDCKELAAEAKKYQEGEEDRDNLLQFGQMLEKCVGICVIRKAYACKEYVDSEISDSQITYTKCFYFSLFPTTGELLFLHVAALKKGYYQQITVSDVLMHQFLKPLLRAELVERMVREKGEERNLTQPDATEEEKRALYEKVTNSANDVQIDKRIIVSKLFDVLWNQHLGDLEVTVTLYEMAAKGNASQRD
ncbi:hypothetical protein D918_05758 [Trichuris suis]|nr:hypothetical protein D918_05758 [Trichuris suis]